MQLGKALLGGIIGAAVGIGLLLVVYLTLSIDKVWLAIPFAIITGLGVRMLVSTSGHASYLRGALTVVLALAAYAFGLFIVAKVATARANEPNSKPASAAAAAEKPAAEPGTAEPEANDAEPKAEAPPSDQPNAAIPKFSASQSRPAVSREISTWDFIWLSIAALVAYELGRGSGTATTPASRPTQPMPAGGHPDA